MTNRSKDLLEFMREVLDEIVNYEIQKGVFYSWRAFFSTVSCIINIHEYNPCHCNQPLLIIIIFLLKSNYN